MIKVGDRVMVLPTCSVAFGGKFGTVISVDPTSNIPVKVSIDGKANPYLFDTCEIVDMVEVERWNNMGTIHCHICGADITGQYTYVCLDCMHPLPKEG